jgi:hypothetical protein
MKKIKTRKIGKARLELISDKNFYVIILKFKDFTYEILRSTTTSAILFIFDDIKVTEDREDIIQFCIMYDYDHYFYHEFDYHQKYLFDMDVNLRKFTKEEQGYHINGYYDSLDEVKRIYGLDEGEKIAQCIFKNAMQ